MESDTNKPTSREEIGRKGGAGTTSTMSRETTGEKVREGWNDLKQKISQKWDQLTDKDLDTYSSKGRNDLVGYVHGRVGGDRTGVERDIDTFARDSRYRFE